MSANHSQILPDRSVGEKLANECVSISAGPAFPNGGRLCLISSCGFHHRHVTNTTNIPYPILLAAYLPSKCDRDYSALRRGIAGISRHGRQRSAGRIDGVAEQIATGGDV
jgi:hypothetical protein